VETPPSYNWTRRRGEKDMIRLYGVSSRRRPRGEAKVKRCVVRGSQVERLEKHTGPLMTEIRRKTGSNQSTEEKIQNTLITELRKIYVTR